MSETKTVDREKLMVVDGHSMAFRAFYALPVDSFVTGSGQHTNAVHGFVSMLLSMIKTHRPTHVAVAFDLDTPTFRSESYEEYKGGRQKVPEEFHGQVEIITQVMKAMHIPTLTQEGFEADDVLATLAKDGKDAGFDVLLVSGDRDAFQLINESVTVLYPKKGVSDIPPVDAAAVEEKYLVTPQRYPDLAALVGETADNLPGVPGVGPKTAAKWINQYGDLSQILAHADEIKGKVGEALRANLDKVERNRRLNKLVDNLEIPVSLEQMQLESPDREKIEELFDALEFNTLRKRLFEMFETTPEAEQAEDLEVPELRELTSAEQLSDFLAQTSDTPITMALAVEKVAGGTGSTAGIETTGLILLSGLQALWAPLTTLDPSAETALATWLESESAKILYDYKSGYKALAERGLTLNGVVSDTVLAAYLLQPGRRSYELDELVQAHLNSNLELMCAQLSGEEASAGSAAQQALDLDALLASESPEEFEETGPQDLYRVPQINRALATAIAVQRLYAEFEPGLIERGAISLLQHLELPLARVLAEMEIAGIAVDAAQMETLFSDYHSAASQAENAAFEDIGHSVNLSSPKQLQQVLFDELDLPKTKKIKTGYSTDVEALSDLIVKTSHPFLIHLLAYRDAIKLKQTVEGLQKSIAPDGRIHTTYSQTVAATGRLSSINPNLQNIPVRSEAGRRIREVFVVGSDPETKYVDLLTADYSQIEMRIMAHLSGDQGLISAFHEGEDLHRFVGSHIFDVEPENVSPAMRSKVKAMSYGLVYGLSSFGLSKQLNISVDEARTLMRDYFERFGAVRDYLRSVVDIARQDGYTETILGRRRYLPELTSSNRQLREMAERMALNAPIQGSAADIIKQAMLGVDKALHTQGLRSRMLLQVHDELVFEVAEGEQEALSALVREQMGRAADLDVPLDVSIGIGKNWQDAAHN